MFVGEKLAADYKAMANREASFLRIQWKFLTDAGFRAVYLYRVGHWCRKHRMKLLSELLLRAMHLFCHCSIAPAAEIGPAFTIRHTGDVIVGGATKIGSHCDIRQGVTFGGSVNKERNGQTQPIVGDHVLVGTGGKILGPVIVGDNVTVGANAVVISDIPSNTIAAGVPARVIRKDGKLIPLIEQDSSLSRLLKQLDERLANIEQRLNMDDGVEN